mgnify:CR=1 FL=1
MPPSEGGGTLFPTFEWICSNAQNVLGYNVVIVGKPFNEMRGIRGVMRERHDELVDEPDDPPEINHAFEKTKRCLDPDSESVACSVFWHATSTRVGSPST